MKNITPIQKAVNIVGGQNAMARLLGLSQPHIYNWIKKNKTPAQHCPKIERLTYGQVRCEDLRQDVEWRVLRNTIRAYGSDNYLDLSGGVN
jgi:DNA-binding transcriptional regulator YdaS (Cro superfamily)